MARRIGSLAALFVTLALVLAACGSSGGSDKHATTTTTKKTGPSVQTVPTTAAPKVPSSFSGGTKATYCKEWSNLLAASGQLATEPADITAKYNKIVDIAQHMLAAAPDEMKDDIQTAIRISKEAANTGSLKPFDTDESKKVGSRIAAYNGKQCGTTTTTTGK